MDGLKFDLRLYVLVTSCCPLTVFWHSEGLARFATQAYQEVGEDMPNHAHLTNCAINRNQDSFDLSSEAVQAGTSSKRKLEHVWTRLAQEGQNVELLKLRIADLIIKTLLSI